jgi:hypothetical protein
MMRPGQLYPRPAKVSVTFGAPIAPAGRTYEEITKELYVRVVGLLEQGSGDRRP